MSLADSESIHARNFKEILADLGAKVNSIPEVEIKISKTKSNLRYAVNTELAEIDGKYPGYIEKISLDLFSKADPDLEKAREDFVIEGKWKEKDFLRARRKINSYASNVKIADIDLERLKTLLSNRRNFLVRLLENPYVQEHETFTDLLWAVFHLAEELSFRRDVKTLPDTDRVHLEGDMKRAYRPLLLQWMSYMKHLKERYPYLFSLAARTNPFDKDASPIIK